MSSSSDIKKSGIQTPKSKPSTARSFEQLERIKVVYEDEKNDASSSSSSAATSKSVSIPDPEYIVTVSLKYLIISSFLASIVVTVIYTKGQSFNWYKYKLKRFDCLNSEWARRFEVMISNEFQELLAQSDSVHQIHSNTKSMYMKRLNEIDDFLTDYRKRCQQTLIFEIRRFMKAEVEPDLNVRQHWYRSSIRRIHRQAPLKTSPVIALIYRKLALVTFRRDYDVTKNHVEASMPKMIAAKDIYDKLGDEFARDAALCLIELSGLASIRTFGPLNSTHMSQAYELLTKYKNKCEREKVEMDDEARVAYNLAYMTKEKYWEGSRITNETQKMAEKTLTLIRHARFKTIVMAHFLILMAETRKDTDILNPAYDIIMAETGDRENEYFVAVWNIYKGSIRKKSRSNLKAAEEFFSNRLIRRDNRDLAELNRRIIRLKE